MRAGALAAQQTPARARRALALGAVLALAGLAATVVEDPQLRLRLAPALLLMGAPLVRERLVQRLAAARAKEGLLVALFAQLAGIALLQAGAATWWAAATLQALARARATTAAALSGLLALGTSVVALREQPSALAFLLPFVVGALVLPALASLAEHAARARLQRARVSLPAATHTPGPVGLRAAVLAWPVVLAALLVSASWTSDPSASAEGPDVVDGAQERAEAAVEGGAGEPTPWDERMSFGEGVGRLSSEVVLWAQPRGRNVGVLYLPVIALDHVDERGLGQPRLDHLREFADGDDGRRDGWIEFAQAAAADTLELRVRQRSLRVGRLGGQALVRVEPLLALDLERVLYEPGTALVRPEASEGFVEYALRCIAPDRLANVPAQARARHADPRYTQLPVEVPAVGGMRELAQDWLGDARGDLAAVERLLERFESDFSYSLEGAGFVGVSGSLEFLLEQRVGYCTTFAAASVLLLRSRGIACRAVGGYLADEWDAERSAFVARGTDAHAWIEVHFEGYGWRTFDPTPAAERSRAFQRRAGVLPPEVSEWSGALWSSLVQSASGSAPGASLARLGANLAQAPAVLRQEFIDQPVAVRVGLTCALALAVVGAWLLQRVEGRRGVGARVGLVRSLTAGPYERLLAQLAERGLRAAGHESLRAFARRVESARVLPGFAQATEAHLAERFGGQAPDARARAHLEALLGLLRRDPLARA